MYGLTAFLCAKITTKIKLNTNLFSVAYDSIIILGNNWNKTILYVVDDWYSVLSNLKQVNLYLLDTNAFDKEEGHRQVVRRIVLICWASLYSCSENIIKYLLLFHLKRADLYSS